MELVIAGNAASLHSIPPYEEAVADSSEVPCLSLLAEQTSRFPGLRNHRQAIYGATVRVRNFRKTRQTPEPLSVGDHDGNGRCTFAALPLEGRTKANGTLAWEDTRANPEESSLESSTIQDVRRSRSRRKRPKHISGLKRESESPDSDRNENKMRVLFPERTVGRLVSKLTAKQPSVRIFPIKDRLTVKQGKPTSPSRDVGDSRLSTPRRMGSVSSLQTPKSSQRNNIPETVPQTVLQPMQQEEVCVPRIGNTLVLGKPSENSEMQQVVRSVRRTAGETSSLSEVVLGLSTPNRQRNGVLDPEREAEKAMKRALNYRKAMERQKAQSLLMEKSRNSERDAKRRAQKEEFDQLRAEIYALNKLRKEVEWQRWLDFAKTFDDKDSQEGPQVDQVDHAMATMSV